jgi:hypothetical protein
LAFTQAYAASGLGRPLLTVSVADQYSTLTKPGGKGWTKPTGVVDVGRIRFGGKIRACFCFGALFRGVGAVMDKVARQRVVTIGCGLFLVKYEAADDDVCPPKVTIGCDPAHEGKIELLVATDSADAAEAAVLWSPGACLVARAEEGGQLSITVEPAAPDGSVAAKVEVTRLSCDPGGVRRPERPPPLDLSGFRLLGHAAGRGDVVVGASDWIGGPAAPSRIEGIGIRWPEMPAGIELRYAVRTGGQQPAQTQLMPAGAYAGTRGRALPVVGATFEMSGPRVKGHRLVVDAIFLGSPQIRVAGSRTVLAGPTGREPLVGLRIYIEQEQAKAELSRPAQIRPAKTATPAEQVAPAQILQASGDVRPAPDRSPEHSGNGKVRVFRSETRKPPPPAAEICTDPAAGISTDPNAMDADDGNNANKDNDSLDFDTTRRHGKLPPIDW